VGQSEAEPIRRQSGSDSPTYAATVPGFDRETHIVLLGYCAAGAVAAGAAFVAKQAKDVIVAKIQAHAQVTVARIEAGLPEDGGGKHRAE
jgi:hypothetical protein